MIYLHVAAHALTIHIAAPPTILTRVWHWTRGMQVRRELNQKKLDKMICFKFQSLDFHVYKSISLSTSFLTVRHTIPHWYPRTCTCSLTASVTRVLDSPSAHVCCVAQHVATPIKILDFREENFHDWKSNHKIHKNIEP